MKNVEDILAEKKTDMEMIEVPEDFDIRIERALSKSKIRKRSFNGWRAAAVAAAVIIVFAGYNYDVLAYYGRKLLGFDGLMNGTLAKLNDLGKGQEIGSSYTFKNGYVFTLDGVMADDSQLIMFYTLKKPGGFTENNMFLPAMSLKGMFGRYMQTNGTGSLSGDNAELKGIQHFEAVNFLEKDLNVEIRVGDGEKEESGEIKFKLDRTKAMGHVLKKDINKKVKLAKDEITFKSILATATKTEIEGSIRIMSESINNRFDGDNMMSRAIRAELIADGNVLDTQGSGLRSDIKGITFSMSYDALPNNLKKLQIKLLSFNASHDVKKQIELEKGKLDKKDVVLDQDIYINDVYEKNGDTYVTITTAEDIRLAKVYLIMDDKKVELKETIPDGYQKDTDGTTNNKRTLHFPGVGNKLVMDINGISYDEPVDSIIDIPVD